MANMSYILIFCHTSYPTTIKTTLYQVVYGQPPPSHVSYTQGDSKADMVDKTLMDREDVIKLLKFHM